MELFEVGADGSHGSNIVKVAAIQFAPQLRSNRANIAQMLRLGKQAAEQGAKLIVFPELATTGYSFMSAEDIRPYTETLKDFSPGTSFHSMQALAKQYGVAVVWGLAARDPDNNKLLNAQVYLDPKGHVETYAKINPWGNDYLWSSPGRSNPPIIDCDVTGLRVGLLICRDVRDKKNDDWNNFYSKGEADVIAFSTNWGDGGFPATTWMDFVQEHDTALIVSNRYGQEDNNNFGEGGSCIITPPAKVQCAGLRWSQDCVILGDILWISIFGLLRGSFKRMRKPLPKAKGAFPLVGRSGSMKRRRAGRRRSRIRTRSLGRRTLRLASRRL